MGLSDFAIRVSRWTRTSDDAYFFIVALDKILERQNVDGRPLVQAISNLAQYQIPGKTVLGLDLRRFLRNPNLSKRITSIACPWMGTVISSPGLAVLLENKDFIESLYLTFDECDLPGKISGAAKRIRAIANEDVSVSIYREGEDTRSVILRVRALDGGH